MKGPQGVSGESFSDYKAVPSVKHKATRDEKVKKHACYRSCRNPKNWIIGNKRYMRNQDGIGAIVKRKPAHADDDKLRPLHVQSIRAFMFAKRKKPIADPRRTSANDKGNCAPAIGAHAESLHTKIKNACINEKANDPDDAEFDELPEDRGADQRLNLYWQR